MALLIFRSSVGCWNIRSFRPYFFRTDKYPGRHLPTDGDRRTHKEKALKKIDEKTQDFLNVGIGGADVHNLVLTPLPVA